MLDTSPKPESGHLPRTLLLANPGCLQKRGLALSQLTEMLIQAGLNPHAEPLPAPEHVGEWRERLQKADYDVILAGGGDGTLHQIVNLVADWKRPLGILPLGTANDFARSVGVPLELDAAILAVAKQHLSLVDLGFVNGVYFLNAAHLGLGVETAKRTSPLLKQVIGPAAYVLAAASAWLNAEPLALEVCLDGECHKTLASQLFVGNGHYFGGGLVAAQEASLEDGLLDVHLLPSPIGAAEALRFAGALRDGTLGEQDTTRHFRTRRLSIRLSGPAQINVDGEILTMNEPLEFKVCPKALGVYAPRAAETGHVTITRGEIKCIEA
jgi:diacylglycerol kinase (ATP)